MPNFGESTRDAQWAGRRWEPGIGPPPGGVSLPAELSRGISGVEQRWVEVVSDVDTKEPAPTASATAGTYRHNVSGCDPRLKGAPGAMEWFPGISVPPVTVADMKVPRNASASR